MISLQDNRCLGPVLALCMAASALFLAGCEEKVAPEKPIRPVVSMVVGDIERIRTDVYPGRAKATQEVNISFEVSGKMTERRVNVGDSVKRGDVLAVLEPDRYKAEVNRLKAERTAALAQLENAEKQLARQEELLLKGFTPKARVDERRAAERSARAKAASIRAAIDSAELDLSHTTVTAPFDGTASETFVENFQNVVAKQPILRLLDTSQIEMEVNVPEALIGLAPHVKEILVRFKTLPDVEIPAKIKEVSNEASLTTRTYPVTIIMDQPEGAHIKPGMAGEAKAVVELPGDWAKKGIAVPAAALFSPDDAKTDEVFVWIVNEADKSVQRRQVQVVATARRGVLIKGIKAKERIVIAGVSFLNDGQKVRILPD
ncbi:MAG: efflux RND transporter periplasmic adaptor subunit [Hyphomicrobiales bacterium]|nr:efflux RND transporter periplasmic adaptor subunit [Hyphomicrobiales bacterium]